MEVNSQMHPEWISIWYDVTQENDRRKENPRPKSIPKDNSFNIWERVDQLPFHLTAAGHLAPWKSQKQWDPGLLRKAWVPPYPCGEEISQKELVTYPSLSQTTSHEGRAWHAPFFLKATWLDLILLVPTTAIYLFSTSQNHRMPWVGRDL